jgi:hypothetical protein
MPKGNKTCLKNIDTGFFQFLFQAQVFFLFSRNSPCVPLEDIHFPIFLNASCPLLIQEE